MTLPRSLPERSIASIDCVRCGKLNDFEREGIPNGFSYLEIPYGEVYTCERCDSKMRIASPFMYGFVKN